MAYAEQNGRSYASIGSYMFSKGYLTKEDLSVQGWWKNGFNENPSKVDDILNLNESYFFFRVSNQNATGALNTVLTPKRI